RCATDCKLSIVPGQHLIQEQVKSQGRSVVAARRCRFPDAILNVTLSVTKYYEYMNPFGVWKNKAYFKIRLNGAATTNGVKGLFAALKLEENCSNLQ
ncbi:MAG: hypothetical protein ACYSUD_16650, partial [Planctomycetota bacterium]